MPGLALCELSVKKRLAVAFLARTVRHVSPPVISMNAGRLGLVLFQPLTGRWAMASHGLRLGGQVRVLSLGDTFFHA